MSYVPFAAAEFPNDNPSLHRGAAWVCFEPCAAARPVVRAMPAEGRVDAAQRVEAPDRVRAEPMQATVPEMAPEEPAPPEPKEVPETASDEPAPPEPEQVPASIVASHGPEEPGEPVTERPEEPVETLLEAVSGEEAEAPPPVLEPEPVDGFRQFVSTLGQVVLEAGAVKAAALLPSLLEAGHVDGGLVEEAIGAALVEAGVAEPHGTGLRVTEAFSATAAAWKSVLRGESEDLSACGSSTLDGWAAELLEALVGRGHGKDLRRALRRRGVAAFGMLAAA